MIEARANEDIEGEETSEEGDEEEAREGGDEETTSDGGVELADDDSDDDSGDSDAAVVVRGGNNTINDESMRQLLDMNRQMFEMAQVAMDHALRVHNQVLRIQRRRRGFGVVRGCRRQRWSQARHEQEEGKK